MPWKELPHTSDLFLEIEGNSLENLMEEAARAMFENLGVSKKKNNEFETEISAPNREEMLVRWLEELFSEHDVNKFIFSEFKVKIEGDKLKGLARGGEGKTKLGIKAVTWHDLKIWQEGKKWKARVLFDI